MWNIAKSVLSTGMKKYIAQVRVLRDLRKKTDKYPIFAGSVLTRNAVFPKKKISTKMIAKKDRNWSVEVTTRPIQEKRTEEKMEYESGRPKES